MKDGCVKRCGKCHNDIIVEGCTWNYVEEKCEVTIVEIINPRHQENKYSNDFS